MNTFLHALAKILVTPLVAILTFAGYTAPAAPSPVSFAGTASNPSVAAIFETSLSAPIGAADTSLSLASISIDSAGDTLVNGATYALTIDQGQPNQEFVQGVLSGTSLTNLTRGLSPLTGTSTVSALGQSHRRGADVKITDWPILGIINNQINGIETIPNLLNYSSNVLMGAGSPTSSIPTKYYVDTQVTAGCSNADTNTKGCVQIATAVQAASSTASGSTAALLALPASMATSSNQVPGLHVVVTQNNGTINKNQIDQTANYTWTATSTFSKALIGNVVTVAANAGATSTIDWSQGNTFSIYLTGNQALVFTNVVVGESIKLLVYQDNTGSRTIANWGNTSTTSTKWASGFAPTLSTAAGVLDTISLYTGTSSAIVYGAATMNTH